MRSDSPELVTFPFAARNANGLDEVLVAEEEHQRFSGIDFREGCLGVEPGLKAFARFLAVNVSSADEAGLCYRYLHVILSNSS